jgi:hypothetical protein
MNKFEIRILISKRKSDTPQKGSRSFQCICRTNKLDELNRIPEVVRGDEQTRHLHQARGNRVRSACYGKGVPKISQARADRAFSTSRTIESFAKGESIKFRSATAEEMARRTKHGRVNVPKVRRTVFSRKSRVDSNGEQNRIGERRENNRRYLFEECQRTLEVDSRRSSGWHTEVREGE